MKPIVVDKKLWQLLQPVEVRDSAGNVVGWSSPQIDPEALASLLPDLGEDELRRREQEPGGRTLAEIMADLQKRAS